jgi:hypothetical protein
MSKKRELENQIAGGTSKFSSSSQKKKVLSEKKIAPPSSYQNLVTSAMPTKFMPAAGTQSTKGIKKIAGFSVPQQATIKGLGVGTDNGNKRLSLAVTASATTTHKDALAKQK